MCVLINNNETQNCTLPTIATRRSTQQRRHRNQRISHRRCRCDPLQTMLSSSFILLCLISALDSVNLTSARIFASENGFDSGGDAPVCWEAVIDTSKSIARGAEIDTVGANNNNSTTNNTNADVADVDQPHEQLTVKELNEILFDEQIVPTFHLLKSCYNGTDLSMEPITTINKDNENFMITSTPYTFRMTLSTELQNVNETFITTGSGSASTNDASTQIDPIEVWMRLVLCKATEVGFCSPYFDASSPKIMSDRGEYVPGVDVLTGWKLGVEEPSSHIATEWITWYLQPQDTIGNKFSSSVDMTFQLESGAEGIYFMLGHAVMYFFDHDDSSSSRSFIEYRVDIADALDGNIVQVKPPPTILRVETGFAIIIVSVVGIATLVVLAMFCIIVYHRQNKLMTLAQGGLLGLLTFTAAIGNITSLFFFPTNDAYCILAGPLCLIPQTLIAAILVGRLWRVYMTLSVANALGRATLNIPEKTNVLSKLIPTEQGFMEVLGWLSLSRCFPQKNTGDKRAKSRSLRRATTRADTLRLIFMLTLPQIILQMCGAIIYPAATGIHLTGNGKLGRQWCDRGDRGTWLYFIGLALLALVYFLAVLVAWFSRNLPSAFNEKDQIFQAASINSVVSMIVISLMFITNRAETSPHITVFLWIALALTLTTVTTWVIVMPKIRRLFSGEKVVVSNMLRRVNNLSFSSSSSSRTMPMGASIVGNNARNSTATYPSGVSPTGTSDKPKVTSVDVGPPGVDIDIDQMPNPDSDGNGLPRRRKPKIIIQEEDPIPKSIEKEMYAMQDLIKSINDDTLHGRPVNIKDWRNLKIRASVLSDEVNRVECDWSVDEGNGEKKDSTGNEDP